MKEVDKDRISMKLKRERKKERGGIKKR